MHALHDWRSFGRRELLRRIERHWARMTPADVQRARPALAAFVNALRGTLRLDPLRNLEEPAQRGPQMNAR